MHSKNFFQKFCPIYFSFNPKEQKLTFVRHIICSNLFSFFFLKFIYLFILIGGQFLYNIMVVFAIYPPYLPPEKSVRRSRSNSQNPTWSNGLVPNWERSISRLYIVAYLTSLQSTSCKMPGWMKHKLESRLPGEIAINSDMQMTPPLWQKVKRSQGAS